MSSWNDAVKWQELLSREGCPVCNQTSATRPPSECTIADLSVSRLIADRNTCLKGHCCLVSKPHAVEFYELSDAEAAMFLRDIKTAARALKTVTEAVKLNYEIHGNTIPHLHMHLWPRHPGDRFEDAPIDWRKKTLDTYNRGEFEAFVEAMKDAIEKADKEIEDRP